MSKRIFTCIALAAMVLMVTAAFAQQGGFHVDTLQAKDEGGNNGFLGRVDLEIQVHSPTYVKPGDDMWVDFEIFNDSGRAIPSVTAWKSPTFKKAGDYASGYTSGGIIFDYDAKGKAITDVSISDGGSLTFTVGPFVPTVAGDFVIDDIEIWTRLGNKNFQDQLFGGLRGDKIVVEVIEQLPTFAPGFGTDKDGALIIDASAFGLASLPNNVNNGFVTITACPEGNFGDEDDTCFEWASYSNGSTDARVNGNNLKIFPSALFDGVFYEVYAELYEKVNGAGKVQQEFESGSVVFYLIMDVNGKVVGAVVVCADCLEAICVCPE